MIRFACYQCGQVFRARDDQAGQSGKCKRCGVPIQIPVFIQGNRQASGPPPGPTANPTSAPNPLGFLNTPPDTGTVNLGGRPRKRASRLGSTLGLPVGVGLAVGLVLILLMFASAEPIQAIAPGIAPKNPFAAPTVRIEPPKNAGGGMSFEPPEWIGTLVQLAVVLLVASTPITVPVALSRAGCLSIGRWLCMAVFCGLACFLMVSAYDAVWRAELARRGDQFFFRPGINNFLGLIAFGTLFAFASGMGCVLAAALHPKPKVS